MISWNMNQIISFCFTSASHVQSPSKCSTQMLNRDVSSEKCHYSSTKVMFPKSAPSHWHPKPEQVHLMSVSQLESQTFVTWGAFTLLHCSTPAWRSVYSSYFSVCCAFLTKVEQIKSIFGSNQSLNVTCTTFGINIALGLLAVPKKLTLCHFLRGHEPKQLY